ncbi:phospholipase-like protein [Tanacetum coccineum]
MSDFYDVKISVRSSVKLLLEIKGLLSVKRKRERLFRDTVFGPWLDIQSHDNDKPYDALCFATSENKTTNGFKRISGFDLMRVLRDKKTWLQMLDEDAVRLCLLIASELVFMGKEKRNFLTKHIMWLVNDFDAWNAFPWGEHVWDKFYQRTVNVVSKHTEYHLAKLNKNPNFNATYNLYRFGWAFKIWILESYPNSKKWWSKKANLIPRGLAWSKVKSCQISKNVVLFQGPERGEAIMGFMAKC